MDSRQLTALLSSLVSQLTLLILLLFPHSLSHSSHSQTLFPLLHHFLSVTAQTTTLLRKRRHTHLSDSDSHPELLPGDSKLARLAQVDSLLVKNPDSFRTFFNMASSTFDWLSGLLEPLLECRDPVGLPLDLSAEVRLGIGLYRLATGSSYAEIARCFRVTNRVAKFCSKQLCRVLCTNFRFWVGFPNSSELDSVSNKFEKILGWPNCCGVIGYTRFKLCTTDHANAKQESIAAQIVVDSSSRILSIVVGFDGGKSNTNVLKSSTLYEDIQGGKLLNAPPIYVGGVPIPQHLLGDNSGNPLLPWLMIPFDDPKAGSNEERFNARLGLARIPMLKTIASLKNWGILSKPIEEEVRNAVAYVGACSILHNALLLREDYSGLCEEVKEYNTGFDHGELQRDTSNMEIFSDASCAIRSALAANAKEFSGQT